MKCMCHTGQSRSKCTTWGDSWLWNLLAKWRLRLMEISMCIPLVVLSNMRVSACIPAQPPIQLRIMPPDWAFGGHWRFLILVIIITTSWIWSLVFDKTLLWILAINIHFEGANNSMSWLGLLGMLVWVYHLDHDCDMFTGLSYIYDPNFDYLNYLLRCKVCIWPASRFGGHWRFLALACYLDHALFMVTGLWYNHQAWT